MKVEVSSYSCQLPNLFEYHSFLCMEPLISDDEDATEKFEIESPSEAVLWLTTSSQPDRGCECAWPESPVSVSPALRDRPGTHVYLSGHR